jgi:hypothetical protein
MSPRVLPDSPVGNKQVALIATESTQSGETEAKPKSSAPRYADRINPRWLRVPQAMKYSGINRSRLFKLIKDGQVASACLQEHPKSKRGLRLIDRLSLDLLLERLCQPIEQRLVEEAQSVEAQQKALAEKKIQIAGQLAAVRERKKGGEL